MSSLEVIGKLAVETVILAHSNAANLIHRKCRTADLSNVVKYQTGKNEPEVAVS